MTAIIKKNFRLQNAKDFLEGFVNHPRIDPATGLPLSIESALTDVEQDPSNTSKGNATYSWSWTLSDSVDLSAPDAQNQLRKDALLGLQETLGSHVVDRNHYLFVGKTTPWKTPEGEIDLVSELYPNPAKDSVETERRIWEEMLGLKKITNISASLVIPRFDWDSSGKTVYAPYDDTVELHLEPTDQRKQALATQNLRAGSFYVLTDQYDLFICLSNNNNSPSTMKPIRPEEPTNLIEFEEDGYVWKFITTIKAGDAVKFLTDSWIPIRTLKENDGSQQWSVQQDATPGAVLSCVVENASANYTNVHAGTISATDVESGAGVATLTADVGLSGVNNAYANSHLYITSGDYAGDVYKIVSYDSTNRKIILSTNWLSGRTPASGTQYEILPIVVVESNGTSVAKIKPVVESGQITKVVVRDPGANATFVRITVADDTAGGGSGNSKAKIRAVLAPQNGLGKDPEKDLNAYFVMMNARLQYSEGDGDFPISNDYRQLGIIRDVLDSNGNLAKQDTLSAIKSMLVTLSLPEGDRAPIFTDQIITQDQGNGVIAKAIVVEILDDPTSGAPELSRKISYIQTPETGFVPFIVDSTKKVTDVVGDIGIITQLVNEEVKRFSGEILYIENRRPILRAEDQLEDIKAIIEF